MHHGARIRKLTGHMLLLAALAVVPVVALNSLARADTSSTTSATHADALRQCLAEHGVTVPPPGSARTDDQIAASKQAQKQAKATCKSSLASARGLWHRLSAAQRHCLAGQGVTATDHRDRAALGAAAQACHITT